MWVQNPKWMCLNMYDVHPHVPSGVDQILMKLDYLLAKKSLLNQA
jgi:hypothetical protein